MDFPYQHKATLPKTTICVLKECLIHHHGIPHGIVSDHLIRFYHKRRCNNGPMLMEVTGLTMWLNF